MKIVKVRRVGNSNVVSLPREFEASGYMPGVDVLVDALPNGELRITPADQLRSRVHTIGERIVSENREALDILANHDNDRDPAA